MIVVNLKMKAKVFRCTHWLYTHRHGGSVTCTSVLPARETTSIQILGCWIDVPKFNASDCQS